MEVEVEGEYEEGRRVAGRGGEKYAAPARWSIGDES